MDTREFAVEPVVQGNLKRTGPSVPELVFRFRYVLHTLIYVLGFALSWAVPRGGHPQRVWLALPELLATRLSIDLHSAIVVVTTTATVFAFAGAAIRTWGAAYLGPGVVRDSALHGGAITAGGPYRFVRNPLYLGTILHTLALAVLMSWAGAAFVIVAIMLLQIPLVRCEERFLTGKLNGAYVEYCRRVPSIIPKITGVSGQPGLRPRWMEAVAEEIYMWGAAIAFAVFGSTYNAVLIIQGVVVSFGISIVVRGLLPRR